MLDIVVFLSQKDTELPPVVSFDYHTTNIIVAIKKIFMFSIATIILIGIIITVKSITSSPIVNKKNLTENFIDKSNNVREAYISIDGKLIKLTVDDYKKYLALNQEHNPSKDNSSILTIKQSNKKNIVKSIFPGIHDYFTYFRQDGNSQVFRQNSTQRISNYMYNAETRVMTYTLTGSCIISATYNANFTSSEISSIIRGSSLSISLSESISDTVSTTIPPNKTQWLQFTPIMNNIWGQLITKDWLGNFKSEIYVDMYYPTSIGPWYRKKADGLVELKEMDGQIQ